MEMASDSDIAGLEDVLERRAGSPGGDGDDFAGVFKLAVRNLQQYAEVAERLKPVETPAQASPISRQIVNGREAAPFGESGANHVGAGGGLPNSVDDGLVKQLPIVPLG